MSSINTAGRFPAFSSHQAKELVEAPQKKQPLIAFSDLHKAPPIIVNQQIPAPLPELNSFSTPQEITSHIRNVGTQIYYLFGATSTNYKPPKEQIDFINKKILTKKPIIDDLAERLSIAREIHRTFENTLEDTLETPGFNFLNELHIEND